MSGPAALLAQPAGAVTPIRPARWLGVTALLVALAAIAALYHGTYWAMILLWARSQTFAHGFVVVPVSAWLVWRRRHALAAIEQRPSAAGLTLLPLLGAAWLLADIANVPVVGQYAATALLPAAVLATLGWRYAGAIAFPLAYLLLAVPFGEVFIPPLVEFTARFTVGALQLSGVPVFRENNSFSIPSGNWSVVEACSGLRYVIASLVLGTLYAYLNYRSARRRLAFTAVALLLPILANGVRAYLIVMLGHWSNMRLAAGVDHLVYGWIFFGIVSLLLYRVGACWRDKPAPVVLAAAAAPAWQAPHRRAIAAATACVALAAGWPLLAASLRVAPAPPPRPGAALAPEPPPQWQALGGADGAWRAPHAGAPLLFAQRYRGPAGVVDLQLAWYASQSKGAELLTHFPPECYSDWEQLTETGRTLRLGARQLNVRQSVWQSRRGRLLVWRWYRQSGIDTGSALLVKLLLAQAKLRRTAEDGADIIVAVPYGELEATPEPALRGFLAAVLPAIDKAIGDAERH